MKVHTISLKNFRCFADLTMSFDPNLTVIIANNGQGKTAVLDALAIAFGPFVGAFDDGKDRAFRQDDLRLIYAGTGNRMEIADGGVSIQATGTIEGKAVTWSRQLTGLKSRTTRKDAQQLTDYGKALQSKIRREVEGGESGTCLPLIAYYPTDRLWNERRIHAKKLSRTSRLVGYTHALETGSDFQLMADWVRYWSLSSLQASTKAAEQGLPYTPGQHDHALDVVRTALNTCLKPSGWGDIDYSLEREEIVARHPIQGELPVAQLSDGIRGVLTLVADIAFRAAKLNPNLGPLAGRQAEGIVLIDEVDLHLHPQWQQTVIDALRTAFPRIQFIMTTHSPQVLSTIRRENIRVIEATPAADAIVYTPNANTYGEPSGDVLESVMQVDALPPIKEKAELQMLTEWVDQGHYQSPEARNALQQLTDALGAEHPQLLRIQRSIKRQEALKG